MKAEELKELIEEWILAGPAQKQKERMRSIITYKHGGGKVVAPESVNKPLNPDIMVRYLKDPVLLQEKIAWMQAGNGLDMEASECSSFEKWYRSRQAKQDSAAA